MNTKSTDKTAITLKLSFTSNDNASLVYDVLNVDKELKGSGVHREFQLKSNVLYIEFKSLDLKRLRVAVNAILKNILLITKTVENFATK